MAQGAARRLARQQRRTLVGGPAQPQMGTSGDRTMGRISARTSSSHALVVPLLVPTRSLIGVATQTPFQRSRPLVHLSQALVHAPRALARLSRTPPHPFRTLLRCPAAIPIPHAHSSTRSFFEKLGCYPESRRRAGSGSAPSYDGMSHNSLDYTPRASSRRLVASPARAVPNKTGVSHTALTPLGSLSGFERVLRGAKFRYSMEGERHEPG